MNDAISILIPTHNRHAYLSRLLEYYEGESFRLFVADSTSIPYELAAGQKAPNYFHLPGKSLTQKLTLVLARIDTPYVLLCADDDFVIPAAIHTCVRFLESQPSYSVAMGNVLCYLRDYIGEDRVEFAPAFLDRKGQDTVIEEEQPLARLSLFFRQYREIFYAVHRTENLKTGFAGMDGIITRLYLNEYLTVVVPLLTGKFVELPILYQVREYAPNTGDRHSPNLDAIFTDEGFKREYNSFLAVQSEAAASRCGLSQDEASGQLDLILEEYAGELTRKKRQHSMTVRNKKVGLLFQRIPIIGAFLIRQFRHWKIRRSLKPYVRSRQDRQELERIKYLILKHKDRIWP